MRPRVWGAAAILALLLLPARALGVPAGPALLHERAARVAQLQNRPPFMAQPLLVSGTDAYRRGEYLYQDYLFDDHGADTVPGLGSSATWASAPLFSPTAGDVLYPADRRFAGDAADLVEFRIRPTARAIVYRLTFAAPSAPGTVVAGIGIDSRHRGGSPVPWPFGAGVSSPGLDRFITVWGTGAAVTQLPSGQTLRLPAEAVRWDARRAQMTISVPRTIMNPRGATWRYVAGTGLWDGQGWAPVGPGTSPQPERLVSGNPLLGASSVLNLAFRFHEPVSKTPVVNGTAYTTSPGVGNWFEDGQAHELAAHSTGGDFADVDFGALTRHVHRFVHPPGRVQARIYGSRLRIPAGVDHSSFPEFGGALQPYLVRLPPSYRAGHRAAVLFALHPSNGGYAVFNVFMPGWGRELGDERQSLVVTPLSRGLDGPDPVSGAFTGAAEADFFEMWADLARHFSLDSARVTVGGYSLGGYAAYALAETWPDLFADVFSVVGAPPANGMNTNLLGNLRWVGVMAWNQADDSEVPYSDASAAATGLTTLGLRHEAWTFPAGGHLAPALRDDWRPTVPFIDRFRLVRQPARIDLRVYPGLDDTRYGLIHDHAYWISRLRVARASQHGDVRAVSRALGRGDPKPVTYSGRSAAGGSPALVAGVRWNGLPRARRANALRLWLSQIVGLRIDGHRARLRGGRRLAISVDTDRRVRIRVDLRVCRAAKIRFAGRGRRATIRRRRRYIVLVVHPGVSTIMISGCRRRRGGR